MAHDPHAGHASADDEYLNPSSGSGHEHTDADVSLIAQFAVWLTIAAIVVHVVMWFMFGAFVKTRQEGTREFPLAIEQGPRLPAGPRLQAKPANEIYEFRRQEDAALKAYGWVDKAAGTVRIPIEEAMRLTVERGLPVRADTAPGQSSDTRSLMPTDASAGRVMERRRQ